MARPMLHLGTENPESEGTMAHEPHPLRGIRRRRPGGTAGGVTLLEVLIVVAVIGIATAVALPLLDEALTKARVNAAGDSMRLIHQGMTDWAKEHAAFPSKYEFNRKTLDPMVRDATMEKRDARSILKRFIGNQIYGYVPDDPNGGMNYVMYARIKGSSYVLRMTTGVVMKRDSARGDSTWTPLDDWTNP